MDKKKYDCLAEPYSSRFSNNSLVSEYKSTNYFSNRSIYRQESYYPAKENDITDS